MFKRRASAVLGILALVAGMFVYTPALAGGPTIPGGLIPVDVDPYYRTLTGATAAAMIEAGIVEAQSELDAAVYSGDSLGVGDVRLLYADGVRDFTLRAIGDNAEVWVANDLSYCPGDPRPAHVVTQEQVDYIFNEFNNVIYHSNTNYFGNTYDRDGTGGVFYNVWEWDWYETDNPQRVMILIYNILDEGYCDPTYPFYVAGYFWPTMNNVYADRNIIHIDSHDWANRVGPGVARPYLYEGTIAHEYEHAIHFDRDPDEPSWVDEGLADLSGYLAGYGHADGHLAYYMVYHRTPLTIWGGGLEDYGESYLFQLYLMENFGGPAFISALVGDPLNGIAGIENQLAVFGYAASFDDIYGDWTVANYLDEPGLTGESGAALGYNLLDIPSNDTWGYSIQWSVENNYGSDNHGNLPIPRYWGGYVSDTVQYPLGDILPYAPMYLTYQGFQPELISSFRGDAASGVAAHSGSYQLWGGRGDLMFNTATTEVALGTNSTLSFWTWYQIEEDWDFGFVQVYDDVEGWVSLSNDDTTSVHHPDAHPDVVANLPGFSGHSDGWVEQEFDLSAYDGETVLLRFLYVTDWATSETGFYVDDIVVADDSGTLFTDDLEGGGGNWALSGWEWTTGLATNDWELTFINPVYVRGKFDHYDITDDEIFPDEPYQRDITTLDTLGLNRGEVTIIVSNHQPEGTSFAANYLLLVEKGDAAE
jgi:hypothetical protein